MFLARRTGVCFPQVLWRPLSEFARRLVAAQDLLVIVQSLGEAIPLPGLLLRWLTEDMQPTMK
jgi:hypothetical protein